MREVEFTALARVLLAQNELAQAASLLERLLQAAEASGRLGRAIEILALQAVVSQAAGQEGAALATLKRALTLAESEGYVRTFVDAGSTMFGMLQRVTGTDGTSRYAAKLLAAYPASAQQRPQAQETAVLEDVEPLTEHEIKVLRLIAAGMSNREVGAELYLSVNTVKWHLKNIYDKLDVHSRIEAVTRAQGLGLL